MVLNPAALKAALLGLCSFVFGFTSVADVGLVCCQELQPSWDLFASVSVCDMQHKAVTASMVKLCPVHVLFFSWFQSLWQ